MFIKILLHNTLLKNYDDLEQIHEISAFLQNNAQITDKDAIQFPEIN
jgi:hypothetical protein